MIRDHFKSLQVWRRQEHEKTRFSWYEVCETRQFRVLVKLQDLLHGSYLKWRGIERISVHCMDKEQRARSLAVSSFTSKLEASEDGLWRGSSLYFDSSHLFFKHRYGEADIRTRDSSVSDDPSTNISHVVFVILGSSKQWRDRGPYVDLWWRPNKTRGLIWLDKAPTLHSWPLTSPPFRVSEDTARFKEYDRHNMRSTIRMSRAILETFKLGFEDVRWFVKVDDDAVVFVDNLVEALAKYDHNGYYYIGEGSESIGQNALHSFNMAFGGAGFAVSYPLAKALARNIDGCLKRYPTLYGEDHLIQSCSAELGVSLTREPGFHQIDLRGDISGFLSAHPQSPLVSLHHVGSVDPIFPHMPRHDALRHLMNAGKIDSSRLLQQIICYDKERRWSLSISWGYSVHLYEELHPPGFLQMPLQTFRSWNNGASPAFMFNVRAITRDPCAMPHVFYLESVEPKDSNQVVSNYIRRTPWKLASCHSYSAESVNEIKVFTPTKRLLQWGGRRRECCEVNPVSSISSVELTVRDCGENEALNWSRLSN